MKLLSGKRDGPDLRFTRRRLLSSVPFGRQQVRAAGWTNQNAIRPLLVLPEPRVPERGLALPAAQEARFQEFVGQGHTLSQHVTRYPQLLHWRFPPEVGYIGESQEMQREASATSRYARHTGQRRG